MRRIIPYTAALLALILLCSACAVQIGYPAPQTSAESILPTTVLSTPGVPETTSLPLTTPAPTVTTPPPITAITTATATVTLAVTTAITPACTTAASPETEDTPAQRKRVAITFDDGPDSSRTYKIVDKLAEYDAAATLFVVGNRLNQSRGAAIAYAVAHGCEIGIHSYTHQKALYYDRCTDEEYLQDMQATADAIRRYVDTDIRLMRPPGGNITAERVAACPYAVILWNVDSNDWRYKNRDSEAIISANVNTIVENVMGSVKDGSIILMHEIYENSYEAFCIILDRLYAEGYEVVTVSKLLGDQLRPGQKYRSR